MRVAVSEARRRWGTLLGRVSNGEVVLITRRGILIAKLVPAYVHARVDLKKTVAEIRKLRKRVSPGKIRIRELIDEGRRY